LGRACLRLTRNRAVMAHWVAPFQTGATGNSIGKTLEAFGRPPNAVVDFDFSDISEMSDESLLGSKKTRRVKEVDPEKSGELLNQMSEPGLKVDSLIALLREKQEDVHQSHLLLAMRRCKEAGQTRELFELFDNFEDWGVDPDKETFAFLLKVTAENKNFSRAEKIFSRMIDDKYRPDTEDYNNFLTTCTETGNSNLLLSFEEMMQNNNASMNERTMQLLGRGYYVAQDPTNLLKIIDLAENTFRTPFDTEQMRKDYDVLRVDQLL